jgi:hypothetical protein
MMQKCKSGRHMYDPELTSHCPQCPVPGLDLGDLSPKYPPSRDRLEPLPDGGGKPAHKRTIAFYPGLGSAPGKASDRVDPVVGWLVANEGPALGRDFRIRWGNNAIGRSPDQAIAISEDQSIHGQKHAFIVFDPDTNFFYLIPGNEKGLVRLHHVGETPKEAVLVTQATILIRYDIITIGASKLIFVPLCDPDYFSWSHQQDQGQA